MHTDTHEYALLGGILTGKAPKEIVDSIKPEYFENPEAKRIFKAIQAVHAKEQRIDDVANVISQDSKLDMLTLSSIADYAMLKSEPFENLAAIREQYDRKVLYSKLVAGATALKSGENIAKVMETITDTKTGLNRLELTPVQEICFQALDEYEMIKAKKRIGYFTGIDAMDEHFKGCESGLYVIAARPHMGKTTFMLFLAYSFAKMGYRVWIHSLEDQKKNLIISLACMILNRDYQDYKAGYIDQKELSGVLGEISQLPLFINEKRFGISELGAEINARRDEIDMVFVDQLSHIDGTGNTIREVFTRNIRGLFKIQKTHKLPLFVSAQINRKTEDRENKQPTMSDLKESGAIEEDADVILFPFRPSVYNEGIDSRVMEVIVVKDKLTKKTGKFTLMKTKGGFSSVVRKA